MAHVVSFLPHPSLSTSPCINFPTRANPSFRPLLSRSFPYKFPPPSRLQRLGTSGSHNWFIPVVRSGDLVPDPQWYQHPNVISTALIVGCGAAITLFFGNFETVLYTDRSHLILLSPVIERWIGEKLFKIVTSDLEILPKNHPDSVRVHHISKKIIHALHRGIGLSDPQWGDGGTPTKSANGGWSKEEEMVDESWGREYSHHLEGLKWEVIVVKDSQVNAFCLPGGKIVVYTGLLDCLKSEAEISTVIGHEVAHVVARHSAEQVTKNFMVALLHVIIIQFFEPNLHGVIRKMFELLLRLPFSRRMEMEADYIGLLLLASAGYDPRLAPKVYEKLGIIMDELPLMEYISTHPSSMRRSQSLSKAAVMDRALAIYRRVST